MELLLPKFHTYEGQQIRIIEVKEDGHMVQIEKDGTIEVWSKNRKPLWDKLCKVPHIAEPISRLPDKSVVLAEIHAANTPATSIPTLMIEGSDKLIMTAFAMPYLAGADMTDVTLLDTRFELHKRCFRIPDYETVSDRPFSLSEDRMEELLQMARDRHIEGWVCKLNHMSHWYKHKPVKTIDTVVMEVQESESASFYGGLKGIIVGLYNEKGVLEELTNVGSGFEADFRMSVDLNSLIGKVAEISYDCVAANGRLRFPRFVRWREDKDPLTCTKEQLT